MRSLIACLGALALLAACSPAGTEAAASKAKPQPFVRGCDDSVWGRLARGYRAESTTVGPLTLVYLPDASTRRYPEATRAFPSKQLVTVAKGHRALVEVPDGAAGRLRLSFDPEKWDRRGKTPIVEGQQAVEFVACEAGEGSPGATQFNGALLIGGRGCYPIDVTIDGGRPRRITVSLGAGRCPGA